MAEPAAAAADHDEAETEEQYSPRKVNNDDDFDVLDPFALLGDCSVCGGQCIDHWAEDALMQEK